jgi:ferredoxin-nitrite reductase
MGANAMVPNEEFTEEQKHYLQGFVAGAGLLGAVSNPAAARPAAEAQPLPSGPEAAHLEAQNRFLAEGKKLTPEEAAKREKHPLDRWDDLRQHAAEGRYPKGQNVLAFKYQGLFYVAPAQDSYMCRLRFPNGIVRSSQMRSLAEIAERFGGGYADVTTRANFQIREIQAPDAEAFLIEIQDAGLCSRGSGADNIRNVTGSPTAGVDPQELIDTRPLSKAMHHYILNHREMYGLPRKFNIAFDGGGRISALEDTNDIGFNAVRAREGRSVPEGVYFRMQLGGITGHLDFARDTGILLKPEECIPLAAAVVRVFIEHGDRTDRKKARLKYVLDRWGLDRYMEEVQKRLPFTPARFPLEECEPRGPVDKHGHIGVHPQKQDGLNYIGVALPVGRLQSAQLRGLAEIADRYGSGTIRLTVWQNLLLSDIPDDQVSVAQAEIEALGLHWTANHVRAGLIACTGNKGCRFAAADTKGHAMRIAAHLETQAPPDQPINIHLTGCHHSCAQHYIGDIGLLATQVEVGDDMVEGYHLYLGGGYGDDRNVAREIYRDVPAEETTLVLARMVNGYMEQRKTPDESFSDFARSYSPDELRALFDPSLLAAPASA